MQNGKKQTAFAALTVLTALALTFGLFRFLYQYDNKYTAGPPYGENGVFSFSDTDLGHPLFLIDGWEFYLDVYDTPADLAKRIEQTPQMVFIGEYSNFSYAQKGHSPFGKATYRLRLDYTGNPQPMSLEIPELFTDYTLWINGGKAAWKGSGSTVSFLMDHSTELVLNVENNTHYYSGMTYAPALGTPEAIERMLSLRTLFYAALFFFAMAMAIFTCVLWLTKERGALLPFGLLCLFFAVSIVHPFALRLGLNSPLWYALEDISRMAMLACAATIATEAAGFSGLKWYVRVVRPALPLVCFLSGATVFIIIPFFPQIINGYGWALALVRLAEWVYFIVCAAAGLRRGTAGSHFILAGGVVLGASFLLNLLDNNHSEPIYTGWQTEYSGFLLVLIFAGLMVARNREILQKNRLLVQHMEQLVQQRTGELHQVLEERKAFFSDLAHNLKAPIAAIHLFVGMIRESNLYLDDELGQYLQMIDSENLEMQQRVQSLRTLNAFDRISEAATDIDIDSLLEQVCKSSQPETQAAGIYLEAGRLSVPVAIKGQREKLLILFENLIFNAVSFTPPEGRITIIPSLEYEHVIIRVADTGSGISAEDLPHVFERFYVGRTNPEEGSGLGLYIAKITVAEMGGTIDVDSIPGQGAVFTLRFPRRASK